MHPLCDNNIRKKNEVEYEYKQGNCGNREQKLYAGHQIKILLDKCTRKSGYNMYRGWTQTDYQNKHYNINQKDVGT